MSFPHQSLPIFTIVILEIKCFIRFHLILIFSIVFNHISKLNLKWYTPIWDDIQCYSEHHCGNMFCLICFSHSTSYLDNFRFQLVYESHIWVHRRNKGPLWWNFDDDILHYTLSSNIGSNIKSQYLHETVTTHVILALLWFTTGILKSDGQLQSCI